MTALTYDAQSWVYRENVTGTGDVFAYLGADGKLYYRVGTSGDFSVLVDLLTSTLPTEEVKSGDYCHIVITDGGLIFVAYIIGTKSTSYGSEYRLVNISGTILASNTIQAEDTDFSQTGYACFPVVQYDITNSKFHFLYNVVTSVMGVATQSLNYGTCSSTGTFTSIQELKAIALDTTPEKYAHGTFDIGFNVVSVAGTTGQRAFRLDTYAVISHVDIFNCTDFSIIRRDEGNTGDAVYAVNVVYGTPYIAQVMSLVHSSGSWVRTVVGTISIIDYSFILSKGSRLSSDGNTLFIYLYLKFTDNSRSIRVYSIPVDISTGTSRALTLEADDVFSVSPIAAQNSPASGIVGLPGGVIDSDVYVYTYAVTYNLNEDVYTPSLLGDGVDISFDITIGSIIPYIECLAFTLPRDVYFDLILPALIPAIQAKANTLILSNVFQISHKLTAFLFNSDDVRYQLALEDSSTIPMIDFTISKSFDSDAVLKDRLRVSVPKIYQEQVIELIGSTISISKIVGNNIQLLAIGIVYGTIVDKSDKVILLAISTAKKQISNSIFTANKISYTSVNFGKRLLRFKPNTTITAGDTLIYNDYASFVAARATTYIGRHQQFTEVSE